jgi:hypothetical protein
MSNSLYDPPCGAAPDRMPDSALPAIRRWNVAEAMQEEGLAGISSM